MKTSIKDQEMMKPDVVRMNLGKKNTINKEKNYA